MTMKHSLRFGAAWPMYFLFIASASFILACVFLFASWLAFVVGSRAETTCVVPDVSGVGVALAHGKFVDIINGSGSFSFGLICFSWILSIGVCVLLCHRFVSVLQLARIKNGPESPVNDKALQSNIDTTSELSSSNANNSPK